VDFEKYWNSNLVVKNIANWKYYKHKKNRDTSEIYLVIEHTRDEYKKPKQHARPQEIFTHLEISYKVYCNSKRSEILSFKTHNTNFDDLDLVSAAILLKYMTINIPNGLNSKNVYSYFSNSKDAVRSKTLLIPKQLTNLSGIETSGFFPSEIKQVSTNELINKIEKKDSNTIFPVVSFTCIYTKVYYRTILVDCATQEPLMMYFWSQDYKN
jgi:hypothetical protein